MSAWVGIWPLICHVLLGCRVVLGCPGLIFRMARGPTRSGSRWILMVQVSNNTRPGKKLSICPGKNGEHLLVNASQIFSGHLRDSQGATQVASQGATQVASQGANLVAAPPLNFFEFLWLDMTRLTMTNYNWINFFLEFSAFFSLSLFRLSVFREGFIGFREKSKIHWTDDWFW